jgi:hypothetical protein
MLTPPQAENADFLKKGSDDFVAMPCNAVSSARRVRPNQLTRLSRCSHRNIRRTLTYTVGGKRVRRLVARMGLEPIYQRPRTTIPHPGHRIWLTLTRDKHPSRVLIFVLSWVPSFGKRDTAWKTQPDSRRLLPRRGGALGHAARPG